MTKVRIKWYPGKFNKRVELDIDRRIGLASEDLVNIIKPLSPGETGKLRDSFKAIRKKLMNWRVETNVIYARIVEFGTSSMTPRPFIRPGFTIFKHRIKKFFR